MLPIKDKKYDTISHPNWGQLFNDHDPEHTMKNKFPFRNIFCIDQKPENLIRTVIQDPVAQAQAHEARKRFAPTVPPNPWEDSESDNPQNGPKENESNQNGNEESKQNNGQNSDESRQNPHKDGQDKDKKASDVFRSQINALHGNDADRKKAFEEEREQNVLQQNQNGDVPVVTLTSKEFSTLMRSVDEKQAVLDKKNNIIKTSSEDALFDLMGGD